MSADRAPPHPSPLPRVRWRGGNTRRSHLPGAHDWLHLPLEEGWGEGNGVARPSESYVSRSHLHGAREWLPLPLAGEGWGEGNSAARPSEDPTK